MSTVSILGLGAMGGAIANVFLQAGRDVTVWNRTAAKMHPLVEGGATGVASPAEAVRQSNVIVVCIDDYTATWALFEEHGLGPLFAGKTLIQFSTGTPAEARATETGAGQHGTRYLDGAILAYPREIGGSALIAISGRQASYDTVAPLLADLSSDVRYLGESIGAAAGLDIAVMSYYIMSHLGLVQAALIAESEGVRRDLLASILVDSLPSDTEEIAHLGEVLQNDDYADPGASLSVYASILDGILAHSAERGLDSRIAEFAGSLYREGVAAGFGDEEVVALIKILRQN